MSETQTPKALDAEILLNYQQQGTVLVDLRPSAEFVETHIPGAINIPATDVSAFPMMMVLLHPHAPVAFVHDDPIEAEEIAHAVHKMQRNPVVGWLETPLRRWQHPTISLEPFPILEIDDFIDVVRTRLDTNEERLSILDVREAHEARLSGIVLGSRLIPLRELHQRIGELPAQAEHITVCMSGERAITGASMLRAHDLNAAALYPGGVPHVPFELRESM